MTLEGESHTAVYIISVFVSPVGPLKGTLRAGVGVVPEICFSFLGVLHPYNLNKSKTVSSHLLLGTCCCCPLEQSNIKC